MKVQASPDGPFTAAEAATLDGVEACVHCGLCLPVCPTYEALGTQMDSPRGRLLLMRAAAEGTIPVSGKFALHMDRCLVCRACETACPNGVLFGRAMESARAVLRRASAGTSPEAASHGPLLDLLFRQVLPDKGRMNRLARLIRFAQASGLRGLVRRAGWLRRLRLRGTSLARLDALLPETTPDTAPLPGRVRPEGARSGSVDLFTGCVMDMLFRKVHRDTLRCLSANGYEGRVPPAQGCCGALHAHAGDVETARELARRNLDAFPGGDPIVVNSAGCGAMLKEYGHLLADDPECAERAKAFSPRVLDVSELLARGGVRPPARPFPERVTYQDACHLAHGQGVKRQPRDLLRSVPGLQWTELPSSDACCGSAGVYNLTQPDLADAILEQKIDHIVSTGASVVAVGNPGCALQIGMGLRRRRLPVRVMHPMEILAAAYGPARSD